ncbi:MAG: single-stranded-DNA-specific exonuclease RecJ [Anaerolineae bacterium]
MPPRQRWQVAEPAPDSVLASLGVADPLIAQVLYNRGVRTSDDLLPYTDPTAGPEHSPFALPGVHEAAALLRWAIARHKRIVVHGDYDVDGLAATALAVEGLRARGAEAQPFIPNRLETGYGLDCRGLDEIAGSADLLLTVDCGVRSLDEVSYARKLGMRVIVTDHHLPGTELPAADAVVCSRLPGPFPELAGVGVAAEVIAALGAVDSRFGGEADAGHAWDDLVALGTVADIAPLVQVNRRRVRRGLQSMRNAPRPGIAALARRAGVDVKRLTAWHIAFVLAPRLNSAGRLGPSQPALDLLLTTDAWQAGILAEQLERTNIERKAQLERCVLAADEQLRTTAPDVPLVFAAHPSYPPGLVGLVASRLSESRGAPAVVVSVEGEVSRGSMRSTASLNASAALDGCAHLLTKHGGHSLAAGFSCPTEALAELQACLLQVAERTGGGDTRPTLVADAEVPLVSLADHIWDWLPLLEPTGCGNPRPLLISRRVRVRERATMGRDGSHLLLTLSGHGDTIRAVGFRMGPDIETIPDVIDIAYELDVNCYNGSVERRLLLQDWSRPD